MLPALFASGGAAAGIALGAGILIGTKKSQGPLFKTFHQFTTTLHTEMERAAAPLIAPLKSAFTQMTGFIRQMTPQFKAMFAAMAPAVQPLVGGLEGLIKNILPGFIQLMRASQPAVQALANVLKTLGAQLGQMFSAMAPGVAASSKVFQSIMHSIGSLLPVIGQLATAFAKLMGPSIELLISTLMRLVNSGLKALIPAMRPLNAAFVAFLRAIQPIIPILSQLISQGLRVLAPILTAVGHAISPLLNALRPVVPMFAQLLNVAVKLVSAALKPVSAALLVVMRALTPLLPIATQLMNVLGKLVIAALAPLLHALLPIVPAITKVAGILGKDLIRAVQMLTPGFVLLSNSLAKLITAILPPLIKMWTQNAGIMMQVGMTVLRALVPALIQIIPPLTKMLLALTPLIVLYAKFNGWVLTLAASFLSKWAPGLARAAADIAKLITWIADAITWFARWSAVGEHWQKLWQEVSSFTVRIWDDIFTFFKRIWNDISSWVTHSIDAISSTISSVWNSISRTTVNIWNSIYDWLHGWWTRVTDFFRTATGWIWDVLHSGWDSMWRDTVSIWNNVENFFRGWFGRIKSGFSDAVSAIGSTWRRLESLFKAPVNFLINTVYDNGIRRFWDDVAAKIPGVPKLPSIGGIATGGVLPGYEPGIDRVHALLSPGEGVLVPEAVQGLGGAPAINAINRAYAGHRGGGKEGDGTLRFAAGGFLPGPISNAWKAVKGAAVKAADIAGIVSALITGNTKAFTNDLDKLVGTSAAGALGTMMTQIPKTLITDMINGIKATVAAAGGGGGKYKGHYGAGVAQWRGDVLKALSMLGLSSGLAGQVLYQMQTECVTLDTMILTRNGWAKHSDVVVGDETIGYNQATGMSEWTPVTAVHHYDAAPTIRYGNHNWSAEFTPNHRWLMERVHRDQRGYRHGVSTREVTATPEMVKFEDMTKQHRLILSRKANTGSGLPITEREAHLLGWIAGDGHIQRQRAGWVNVNIYQSKQKFFNTIDYACGADPHYTRHNERPSRGENHLPTTQWHLTSEYARDLLSRAGDPKTDAVQMVLEMSAHQRNAWLEAVLCAEGSVGDNRITYWQNAGEIADAIEIAVYLEGNRPMRSERMRSGKLRCSITEGKSQFGGPSRRTFTEDLGLQPVWCVSTELGSWSAKGGDGRVFLTGNSGGNPLSRTPLTIRTPTLRLAILLVVFSRPS
jgi:phage-related protein